MATKHGRTQSQSVIVGVDTHQRTHHAAVVDEMGRVLADREFEASKDGYRMLTEWAGGFGSVWVFGIESTGSYGAGLTRHVLAAGGDVIEVNRPNIVRRVTDGKSDPIDAVEAARSVLSGVATARPKITTGAVESVRVIKIARDGAMKARIAAMGQLRDLATTAPEAVRQQLLPLSGVMRIRKAAAFRPDLAQIGDPVQAARMSLRALARRIQALDEEIAEADAGLEALLRPMVPTLLARPQIGIQSAAQLVITAGQNIDRLHSEAAFAKLTGVAPRPASSGKTTRMRLSRGGDRQANKALHLIAVGRLKGHSETLAYVHRRSSEGLSHLDIIRCLKRAIARETYTALKTDLLTA